jgi:anti-sigma factor RsiW
VSDHSRHDLDELSEYLDDRLPEPRRGEVRERLRECGSCREAQAALLWAKGQARKLAEVDAPAGLEAEIQARLHLVAAAGEVAAVPAPARAAGRRRHLPALAAAAALIIGLAFLCWRLGARSATSLPQAVAEELRARSLGKLRLAVETTEVGRLEAFLADQRLGFEPRVLDLGMMGFTLRGGSAGPLAGRPSALMVYLETATGHEVLCRMLREGLSALPPPDEARLHDGILFQVYRLGEVTVVFWPEGHVLCALAGRGEPEAVVRLAFGKAMKASARD